MVLKTDHTTQGCIIKTVVTWQGGSCGQITTPVLQNTAVLQNAAECSDHGASSSSHQCNVALTSWRVGARLAARPWHRSSGSAFCTMSGRRCPAPLWRVVNNYSYTGLSPSCRWPCQPCSLGPDTTWVHQKEHPESDPHWPVHFELVSEVSLRWANAVGPHLPGE